MKKFVFSLILACVFVFCGCSCSSPTILNFENSWNGGNGGNVGYTEKLTYSVSYSDEFSAGGKSSYVFEKSSNLSNVEMDFNGTYTTELSIISAPGASSINEIKNSDILDGYSGSIFKLETYLSVTASYTYDETTKTYPDSVKTVTYYCNSGSSFAPLYSKTENSSTILKIVNSIPYEDTVNSLSEIFYSKNSYLVKSTNLGDNLDDNSDDIYTEKTYSYTAQTLIDNTQLLFTLRNLKIEKESSKSLPTVSATYGKAQNLTVSYFDDREERFDVETTDKTYSMKGYAFASSSISGGCSFVSSSSGRVQLVFIANNQDYFGGKAQIMKYVEPLTTYDSSYSCMGALIYNLTSTEFN